MAGVQQKSLQQLYAENSGKVADKWRAQLEAYETLFAPLRQKPIRLLEIGIQNGGSLEIWAAYFPNAESIVGCDIEPSNAELAYDDPRVKVVVGDIRSDETHEAIRACSATFDIIIDDGSHRSGQVIKAFAKYFPSLSDGGLFVVEDLHCSYWREYEGGFYYPFSSMEFFKSLADVLNREHWRIDLSRLQLLDSFSRSYGVAFSEQTLSAVHSVHFTNSLCVVQRARPELNTLHERVIVGKEEPGSADGEHSSDDWAESSRHIAQLGEALEMARSEAELLRTRLVARDESVSQVVNKQSAWTAEIASLKARLATIKSSRSWRMTAAFRNASHHVNRLLDYGRGALRFGRWRGLGQSGREARVRGSAIAAAQGNKQLNGRSHVQDSFPADGGLTSRGLRSSLSNRGAKPYPTLGNDARSDRNLFVDRSFGALSGLEAPRNAPIHKDTAKLIAFYLPQYHRIPENSEWWGPGFTEWNNVARAKPNFDGHCQPRIPRELGYYDLSYPGVLSEQVELAKLYGIYGFCFYYYWFSGRRVLSKPLDNFLSSDIDMNFCLCWANENWTRTWNGDTKAVLLRQHYSESDAVGFIDSLIHAFRDERYIKIDEKPLLVVYRAKDIPNPKAWFKIWRERVVQQGFAGLHIALVDFYDIETPDEVDADSLIEFPSHEFNRPGSNPDVLPPLVNPDFAGTFVDYNKIVAQSARRARPPFKLFRGIMPAWDDTPRRQNTPTIVLNACPEVFGAWLSYLRCYTRHESADESSRYIFVNAWNEWGDGCFLEPDQLWGLSYLDEVLKSSYYDREFDDETAARELLLRTVGSTAFADAVLNDRLRQHA